VEFFWANHCSSYESHDTQYMTALFYRDSEEKKLAEAEKVAQEKKTGKVYTKVLPMRIWTNAEDYHQKYYLRGSRGGDFIKLLNMSNEDILNSTLAAKLNAAVDGRGNLTEIKNELNNKGIPVATQTRVLELCKGRSY